MGSKADTMIILVRIYQEKRISLSKLSLINRIDKEIKKTLEGKYLNESNF